MEPLDARGAAASSLKSRWKLLFKSDFKILPFSKVVDLQWNLAVQYH